MSALAAAPTPLRCPQCGAVLQVIAKTFLDVDPRTATAERSTTGTRYDLVCAEGHVMGGDYSYRPDPESIREAVLSAAGCVDLPSIDMPERT